MVGTWVAGCPFRSGGQSQPRTRCLTCPTLARWAAWSTAASSGDELRLRARPAPSAAWPGPAQPWLLARGGGRAVPWPAAVPGPRGLLPWGLAAP
eukprot:13666233-Alexandrium_andersonii.AAC.1